MNMETHERVVVGAGLAGLAYGIRMLQAGHSVTILERSTVNRNKVCGEFISLESLPIIESFGLDISTLTNAIIDQAALTNGRQYITFPLKQGGFGLSRKTLDTALAAQFKALGGTLEENCRVQSIEPCTEPGTNGYNLTTSTGSIRASKVIHAAGKSSQLGENRVSTGTGYMGIKNYIEVPDSYRSNTITLNFFDGGYMGTSRVEGNRMCVCSLVAAKVFSRFKNVELFLQHLKEINPHIATFLEGATFLLEKHLVIQGFDFAQHNASNNQVLNIGDTNGMVPPLSGNGMSIALRSGVVMADSELAGKPSQYVPANYTQARLLQKLANFSIGRKLFFGFQHKPLLSALIEQTHSRPW
jgi:menaquinone-9 beta-reductase